MSLFHFTLIFYSLSTEKKDVERLVSVAYNDNSATIEDTTSSIKPENESNISTTPSADKSQSAEKRARMQKLDAERLVDALRSLKYYTERKLAQLTGGGGGGEGGGVVGKKNGKVPGRLSSGSESDVGDATSDEDIGCEGGGGGGGDGDGRNEGTVELFWSRWDDPAAGGENAALAANVHGVTNGTRHHSLSLSNNHGVNDIVITVSTISFSSCSYRKRFKLI